MARGTRLLRRSPRISKLNQGVGRASYCRTRAAICSRYRDDKITKEYKREDAEHPAKLRVNKAYAELTKKVLGTGSTHLILDSGFCVTSKTLVKHGFSKDRILVPNNNKKECLQLRRYGVQPSKTLIEAYLYEHDCAPDALWYDSMTCISGNKTAGYYPCMVVDQFLHRQKKVSEKRCVVALTLSTRNAWMPVAHYGPQKEAIAQQVEYIILLHKYKIIEQWQVAYKKNMLYVAWVLEYDPSMKDKCYQLITWKGKTSHMIGFPPGYVLMLDEGM